MIQVFFDFIDFGDLSITMLTLRKLARDLKTSGLWSPCPPSSICSYLLSGHLLGQEHWANVPVVCGGQELEELSLGLIE